MLWEIDIHPRPGQPDRLGERVAAEAIELGLTRQPSTNAFEQVRSAQGFFLQATLEESQVQHIAQQLLTDPIVEFAKVAPGTSHLMSAADGSPRPREVVWVLPKPGVMDPVAESALRAIRELGMPAEAVRTFKKIWVDQQFLQTDALSVLCAKSLANEAIEHVVVGPLALDHIEMGSPYQFRLITVPLRELNDLQLQRLSHKRQLYLSLAEMRTIQSYYCELGREPTDAELETLAQTWSEHCSHKTLKGRIHYRDERGERQFDNMLKETIFAATQQIRRDLGADDWCVSVFEDNAGIVRFDDETNVVFKVETHNHPSAIEPYGGANTGLGGVIRDSLGTGLGAKPVCNTDVFCFAPPEFPVGTRQSAAGSQGPPAAADCQLPTANCGLLTELPPGVLHPKRVMKGVVAGVRDYGNRMGIPTVNGAIYFDERYVGNPLVFCGDVGLIPRSQSRKEPRPGDLIVAVGGRTGRDGIHGATFSSTELTSESETVSGGAVQIGNAITEKMVVDVLLAARDRGLYHAITDCGAGGFSSAVGEMGEKIGAEVQLDAAPLKYDGLSYTEIWISEAQERMVLAVPPDKWDEFHALCASEGVEATVLGRFVPTGRLVLKYRGQLVADLSMKFLHDGRPPVVREAVYEPSPRGWGGAAKTFGGVDDHLRRSAPGTPAPRSPGADALRLAEGADYTQALLRILGSLNVASKEWVIRQYDHEVQGGSVVKPLVGVANDGPSDAAVVRPRLGSRRGIVIACGMNPRYGDLDPYHMAASAIDEAIRNCVAVGADPRRIALLDNFCWGNTDRPEQLGSLVRAALACHDLAVALGTPFISGKDSLNNEYRFEDSSGQRQTITIPPTLLISAIGQIADVRKAVTMDLKEPGNLLYLVGLTRNELGGSHYLLALQERAEAGATEAAGHVPHVDPALAKRTFAGVHKAIDRGLVRACHDLSEGGLAAAAAEMGFAGGLGAKLELRSVPSDVDRSSPDASAILLFSESNSRFLCEVRPQDAAAFEALLDVPHARTGEVTADDRLRISGLRPSAAAVIDAELAALKEAWQRPLRWE
jgi:phosphoribosylformylglycinamidine (FGAM) synthase-like enzyme/phosphoribosylformylglycinamidine (FGAM) synthase PurS component